MKLWQALSGRTEARDSFPAISMADYAQIFSFLGNSYAVAGGGTSAWMPYELADPDFIPRIYQTYKSSGVVFACELVRMLVLAEARFQWQRMRGGRPGELFGTPDLAVLERPWPNATTGELISRMEQDGSFAGNAYIAREPTRLRRLRPDWVSIILTAPPAEAITSDVVGYLYRPGGGGFDLDAPDGPPTKLYLPEEVCHYSPIPDPEAQYRGMSWLTPVVREIAADKASTLHQLKFFENGATPQLAVALKESVTEQQFKEFMRITDERSAGVDNAYRTLYLGGGADVTVVGKDLQQLDLSTTQGGHETRVAAAAGVPAIIAGFREGLANNAYRNFPEARRRFADATVRPLWRCMASSLETIVPPPPDTRLWYDDRDVPFLHDDQVDVATVGQTRASTIASLVSAGYDPDAAVEAVMSNDFSLLKAKHTGLYSVQLQPAGKASSNGNEPAPTGAAK